MVIKKGIVILTFTAVLILSSVSPAGGGLIGQVPVLSLENTTLNLDEGNPLHNTTINGSLFIGQLDMSQASPILLWYEIHTNIVASPGGLMGEHPIYIQHQIQEGYGLYYSFRAELYNGSGDDVGDAYAYEVGEDPPDTEPKTSPLIEVPLADPRPTPFGPVVISEFIVYGYTSPPVEVGRGSLRLSPPSVDIDPDTLNLKSKGRWITCYIELPVGYNVSEINIGTILLNGVIPAEDHPTEIGDHDGDGVPDLMVKFDRAEVIDILAPGDDVVITVTGEAGPDNFEISDTIRVISPGK